MSLQEWMPRLSRGLLGCGAVTVALVLPGCKTLNERYIALEVWKYEKCFGHLPPGFVPPGAAAPAAAPPRVCGQGAPCATAAPCAGAETIGSENCNSCNGAMHEGGLPAGTTIVPGSTTIQPGGTMIPGGTTLPPGTTIPGGAGAPVLPAGPGGAPGPVSGSAVPTLATPVSTGRPVVISDEVVLP